MIKLFGQYLSVRRVVFILGEGLLIFSAITLAMYVFLREETDLRFMLDENWWKILIMTVVTQISLYFNDLYEIQIGGNRVELADRLVQAIGLASVILAIIYILWPGAMIGRWVFFLGIVVLVLFVVSWRLLYSYVVLKRFFSEKTLLLGDGDLAKGLHQEIRRRGDIGYDVCCVLGQEGGGYDADHFEGVPVKHGFECLRDVAAAEGVSNIIVALDQKRGVMPYNDLLACKMKGIAVIDGESFYERITGKLLVEKILPSWLVFSDGFKKSATARLVKRTTDLLFSLLISMLLAPLFAVVAVAIKLESKGRVFFKQERVGEYGKTYMVYKFRSMIEGAEAASGPIWAKEDDPRITRVGRVIRRLRIDELPQLWNVIKGDMSFVGPRPERPFFVEALKRKVPYYNERFTVKPGITGWAQVMYGYGATEEDALEKLKYDLYYIKNMSLMLDLAVIFHTVKIVLLARGSR
ncbi:MAG: glycosyl transferase [Deltaproteobacteria bacterium]|nr:glycosyl transferase [Deltaproteobacteria bacterium]